MKLTSERPTSSELPSSRYGSIESNSSASNNDANPAAIESASALERQQVALTPGESRSPPTPAIRQRSLRGSQVSVSSPQSFFNESAASSGSTTTSQSESEQVPVLPKSSALENERRLRISLQQELAREIAERNRNLAAKLAASSKQQEPTSPTSQHESSQYQISPEAEEHEDKMAPRQRQLLSPGKTPGQSPLSALQMQRADTNEQASFETRVIGKPAGQPVPLAVKRPYPKKVFFIVANEFCERFSYYGLRAVLVLYFKSVIGFSDSNSTIAFHMFATLCYLTPILGAILGDSVWGKFKTIFYLSIVYFVGELVLVISAVVWYDGFWAKLLTFTGLLLIGIGTGGIKPCVSAFGGDQFLPNEDKRRQMFFSIFYASINLGSLVSMFVTPILRSQHHCVGRQDCYPYAFGLPCMLMLISLIVFLMAKNHYTQTPLPEQNIIVAFVKCIWLASRRKLTNSMPPPSPPPRASVLKPPQPGESTDSNQKELAGSMQSGGSNSSMSSTGETFEVVQKSSLTNLVQHHRPVRAYPRTRELPNRSHWLYLASDKYDAKTIEGFRSVLSILLLFVPIPVYWCLYDQQGSLWTLQAARMDGRVLGTNYVLEPDQMSVANPVLLLATIPVFEALVYPGLRRYNLLTSPISRITFGGFLAALSFVMSGMIELRIQEFTPSLQADSGQTNLLLVNGLPQCSIVNASIVYLDQPRLQQNDSVALTSTIAQSPDSSRKLADELQPFALVQTNLRSRANLSSPTANYQFQFHLVSHGNSSIGCPVGPSQLNKLSVEPFEDKSSKILYLTSENGNLNLMAFNESLALPGEGKARVLLLYESYGSTADAARRRFHLSSSSAKPTSLAANSSSPSVSKKAIGQTQFDMLPGRGIHYMSKHLELPASSDGTTYALGSTDSNLRLANARFVLQGGTRNLLLVGQHNSTSVDVRPLVLQDNSYRISMLWQLAPYLVISISEVMFSITGLEFSYSMSPDNMKSVILGAWCLTTAVGNMLTVFVEAIHPFSNIVHDFLFYAAILSLDMVAFALLAKYHKPYRPSNEPGPNRPSQIGS